MSRTTVAIWHCDAGTCIASAPERTTGWWGAVTIHGCPTHAEVVAAHKDVVTHETRGRGRSEKTTWYLHCACGWAPQRNWDTYSAQRLRDEHLAHVRAATPTETKD